MPPFSSTDEITADLTEPQRQAVTHGGGPLLVLAGAGSGKTRVITRRIAHLLARGVAPDRVVAVTFTNKAADEMRRRVEAMVGRSVYLTTFHSFGARLLRREIGRLGRDPSFTIYDRADSLRVVRRLLKDLKLDEKTYPPAEVIGYISDKKDRVLRPDDCGERAFGFIEKTFVDLYRRYEQKLVANNALDFDDLLIKVLDVFSARPDVLRDLQDRYQHVLIDEYQDTNLPQHLIARALQGKHHNITAVGDPDQMIYTWRGARLQNLLDFEEDFPGTRIVILERNYRSSANILRAAGHCIKNNRLRHEKTLWTERDDGAPVLVREFADPYDEGRWVAEQTQQLIEQGTEPAHIAVFYRTKSQSLPLEQAFADLSLPHQVVDSVGFFDRKVVKDLRSYLQLLVNPRDNEAFVRVVNTPARGIGDKTVEKLQAAAAERRVSLLEVARAAGELDGLSKRAQAAIGNFWRLYESLDATVDSVEELVRALLAATDYVEGESGPEDDDVEEMVDQFLGYARQYDEHHAEGGLMGFLEQAALVSDVDGWSATAGAVPFMTLHSAKGLEFDAVFIVGLEEGLLPHRRALEDPERGSDQEALEEERRLFYVGMTRARHQLFITCAGERMSRGQTQSSSPSRFLEELPQEGVDRPVRPAAPRPGASSYRQEVEYVLNRKRAVLRILDGAGDRLTKGTRVEHASYGEGEVIEVNPMGGRHMVRVNFFAHGAMVLLLGAGDISPA